MLRKPDINELQLAIKSGSPIDGRTRIGKTIQCVKTAVRENLTQTARSLLEQDIAFSQTIQQICAEKAFESAESAVRPDGTQSRAMSTWSKHAMLKRGALLALKKFQEPDAKDLRPTSLADIIIKAHDEDDEDIDNGPGTAPRVETDNQAQQNKNWNFTLRHEDPTDIEP